MTKILKISFKHFLAVLGLYIITAGPFALLLIAIIKRVNPLSNWPWWLVLIYNVAMWMLFMKWFLGLEKYYSRWLDIRRKTKKSE